jgi:hypothetical protein
MPVNTEFINKRITIATEFKQLKKIVAFQKMVSDYPLEAVKAMFNLIQTYLKNESDYADTNRRREILILMEFFKYSNYSSLDTWWDELYEAQLMSGVLEEIMALVM